MEFILRQVCTKLRQYLIAIWSLAAVVSHIFTWLLHLDLESVLQTIQEWDLSNQYIKTYKQSFDAYSVILKKYHLQYCFTIE